MPWNSIKEEIVAVVLEDVITTVGNYAFNDCFNLNNGSYTTTLISIGGSAFRNCSSLITVDLSNCAELTVID